jgi:1-acyl-sn-glycerol-3-phosphate acyltransferase
MATREQRAGNGSERRLSATDVAVSVAEGVVAELHPGRRVYVRAGSSLERDLGLDSLALMELRERLEEALDTSIPDEALQRAVTLNDLLESAGEIEQPKAAATPVDTVRDEGAGVRAPDDAGTLLEVLDWYSQRHPQRLHIRLVGEGGTEGELSFEALRLGAERVAGGLQAGGLEAGETVALMLPTSLAYFETFFGVMMAGGIPVPIYPPARPSQLEDHVKRHAGVLDNAQASVLITVPEGRSVGRLLRAQVASLRSVTTPDEVSREGSATVVPSRPEQLAMLQYTSGSTASPKGVELTHANLLANIRAMANVAEVDPASDVFVSWLPLYHDMGLIGAWFGSLVCGMPLVVMSPLTFLSRPVRWLRAIHEHGGTISAAPNFAYELSCTRIREQELEGIDLSGWRLALNGAEPVSPDTVERFVRRYRSFGLRSEAVFPVYGLAECTVGLTFPPPGREPRIDHVSREAFSSTGRAEQARDGDRSPLRFVSCGFPIPAHEVRIADERGRELEERVQGRILFRGPSATHGYHRNAQATSLLMVDDWLDTGDLGYLADGELFVTGRIKDLIIRAGRNLHPQEIEDAVGSIEGVRRGCVAAFSSADPRSGTERLVVVAETREEDEAARADLESVARTTVSEVTGLPPDEVVLAPPGAVLKTSSGKIRRAATLERYEAGRLHQRPAGVWKQALRVASGGIRPQLGRSLRALVQVAFGLYALMVGVVVGAPALVAILLTPGRKARWWVARRALRTAMLMTRTPLSVEGSECLPEGPSVLVAPHSSPLDGPALVAAVPEPLTFVVIEDVERLPVIGRILRRLGAIFIDRDDRARAVVGTERLVEAARRGERLVIFPESTMSAVAGLRSLHMGAFVIAARATVPVVPVAVEGTAAMVGPRGRVPRPGRLRVAVGRPILPSGDGWSEAVRIRRQARDALLALMDVRELTDPQRPTSPT